MSELTLNGRLVALVVAFALLAGLLAAAAGA